MGGLVGDGFIRRCRRLSQLFYWFSGGFGVEGFLSADYADCRRLFRRVLGGLVGMVFIRRCRRLSQIIFRVGFLVVWGGWWFEAGLVVEGFAAVA